MFLYRERPSMIPNSVPIILNKENFMEIMGRRREGAKDDTREHTCKKQEEVESRIDFQATADEKTPKADRAPRFVFAKKQSRNEETTQYEKQVHTHPSNVAEKRPDVSVKDHHRKHSDTPQDVESLVSHVLSTTFSSRTISRR